MDESTEITVIEITPELGSEKPQIPINVLSTHIVAHSSEDMINVIPAQVSMAQKFLDISQSKSNSWNPFQQRMKNIIIFAKAKDAIIDETKLDSGHSLSYSANGNNNQQLDDVDDDDVEIKPHWFCLLLNFFLNLSVCI